MRRADSLIPTTVLVVAGTFPGRLSAQRVAGALAGGLRSADPGLEARAWPLHAPREGADEAAGPLPGREDVRAARAVVLADAQLCGASAVRGGRAFEVATLARQCGVPAYAVTGAREPDLFAARLLDFQVVLHAGSERSLKAAGRRLAALVA